MDLVAFFNRKIARATRPPSPPLISQNRLIKTKRKPFSHANFIFIILYGEPKSRHALFKNFQKLNKKKQVFF